MSDRDLMAVQIGRPLRADSEVVARCHLGLPVVARVPPFLDDGTPFPTRYWLTCPLAVRRVGRLESVGGVTAMERRAAGVPEFGARLEAAHARHAAEREALIPSEAVVRPSGGVAGVRTGVKCLHAHYADFAAGNDNPVGEATAPWVEPLDCLQPCAISTPDGAAPNPDWREA